MRDIYVNLNSQYYEHKILKYVHVKVIDKLKLKKKLDLLSAFHESAKSKGQHHVHYLNRTGNNLKGQVIDL